MLEEYFQSAVAQASDKFSEEFLYGDWQGMLRLSSSGNDDYR